MSEKGYSASFTQTDVQNALRVLTHVAKPEYEIRFTGGDLLYLNGLLCRTQDAAEDMHKACNFSTPKWLKEN